MRASDDQRHDTTQINPCTTNCILYCSQMCLEKKHNDGIMAAVSCVDDMGTWERRWRRKKNVPKMCFFSLCFCCRFMCDVIWSKSWQHIAASGDKRWVPNAPTYHYLIYQIQMIFTVFILHFILSAFCWHKANEGSRANWPLCSVADNMISFVVIQLEDWIHISFVNKRRLLSITAAGFFSTPPTRADK